MILHVTRYIFNNMKVMWQWYVSLRFFWNINVLPCTAFSSLKIFSATKGVCGSVSDILPFRVWSKSTCYTFKPYLKPNHWTTNQKPPEPWRNMFNRQQFLDDLHRELPSSKVVFCLMVDFFFGFWGFFWGGRLVCLFRSLFTKSFTHIDSI